jgi:hypothetical protein
MTTYTEQKGKESINWNDVLERGMKDELSEEEYMNFYELSLNWVTCACGNLCAAIPRNQFGVPKDKTLSELGKKFALNFYNGDFNAAKTTLEKIETRSTELLKEMRIL